MNKEFDQKQLLNVHADLRGTDFGPRNELVVGNNLYSEFVGIRPGSQSAEVGYCDALVWIYKPKSDGHGLYIRFFRQYEFASTWVFHQGQNITNYNMTKEDLVGSVGQSLQKFVGDIMETNPTSEIREDLKLRILQYTKLYRANIEQSQKAIESLENLFK